MSDEYIKRDDAIEEFEHRDSYSATYVRGFLKHLPSADVAPVRHGRWDFDMSGAWCSVCGEYSEGEWNYCPNCGARMDGGNDETD